MPADAPETESADGVYRAGEGEPVVLLHGFTGTWRHWTPLLPELSERYAVTAPTLAGHEGGPAFDAEHETLSLQGAADSLEAHLDELGLDTAHLVGNSMGGALALQLATRGRARSVVALAPACGWVPGSGEAERLAGFFGRLVTASKLADRTAPFTMRQPLVRFAAFRDIMRHGDRVPAPQAVELVRGTARCLLAGPIIDALREEDGVVLTDLDTVKCPVLLATSEHDRVLPRERNTDRFLDELPDVEHRVVPGVGHLPMWDAPKLLTETITAWIDARARP